MYTNIDNEAMLIFIDGLTKEWAAQFDTTPPIKFDFSIIKGELYLGGEAICPVDLIDREACSFDVECMMLHLKTGDNILIHIIWDAKDTIKTYVEMLPAARVAQLIE